MTPDQNGVREMFFPMRCIMPTYLVYLKICVCFVHRAS